MEILQVYNVVCHPERFARTCRGGVSPPVQTTRYHVISRVILSAVEVLLREQRHLACDRFKTDE